MKSMLTTIVLLLAEIIVAQHPNFKTEPKHPEPGQTIRIIYTPDGTALQNKQSVEALVFLHDGSNADGIATVDIKLTQQNGTWEGKIPTKPNTKALLVAFASGELIDNNGKKGYSILLHQKGKPMPGAHAALAMSYGWGFRGIKGEPKPEQILALYEKELEHNPWLKEQISRSYVIAYKEARPATAGQDLQSFYDQLVKKKDKTAQQYETLKYMAENIYKKTEDATAFQEEGIRKYPDSKLAAMQLFRSFYSETDIGKKEAMANKAERIMALDKGFGLMQVQFMWRDLAGIAAEKEDWATMQQYATRIRSKDAFANALNSVAWALSGEHLDSAGRHLDKARQFSAQSIRLMEEERRTRSSKPSFMTSRDYIRSLDYDLGNLYDTYALILWKLNQKDSAAFYQEKAIELTKGEDKDMFYRFTVFLQQAKSTQVARTMADRFLALGKNTPALSQLHQQICLQDGFTQETYNKHKQTLLDKARAVRRKDLVEKLVKEPAHAFNLKDLSGNDVSLASLSGKIVIVDFWAIWCGPCRASFPGMQQVQNKYAGDNNVHFLYIDTWENKEPGKMRTDAQKFIDENKYSFHVLLDTNDKVISDYGVNGIPTKFVIDGKGQIRFVSSGSAGVAETVEDISLMIEILRAEM